MTGIAGLVTQHDGAPAPLLRRMAQSLCLHSESTPESWLGSKAALCRVRVGFDNPVPQPFFTEDGKKCAVIFGEVYGYENLKKELVRRGHRFGQAESDAEFCLRLYQEFGESQFDQLSGSFCFAIHDTESGDLVLVSDRLGTRPLFYGTTPDGKFIFASQVAPILACPEIDRSLNVASAIEFCTLQRVLGEKTHHIGIQMLPPASVLRYRAGKLSIWPYWHPQYHPHPGSADEYAEELARVMRNATRQLTRGDARVAMLLSGGLDARMVVAATEGELDCFSFGDYENPEVQTARRIAEARGFDFTFLQRDPDHYPRLLDRAVDIGNGMHPFNHGHAIGFIERVARQCDVVTHGYVPELMFRGTSLPKSARQVLGINVGERLDRTLDTSNLAQRILRRGYSLLGKDAEKLFTPETRVTFHEVLAEEARRLVLQAARHSDNVYDQYLWPDIHYHGRYPSMLFETSLRPFMTERSPFFHNDVIDLHLKMPVQMRADNRVWLKAVARLNKKIARIPDANTGYAPNFPVALASCIDAGKKRLEHLPALWRLTRRKQSNGQPPGASDISWPRFDWLVRHNANLRRRIEETLEDTDALPPHIFDIAQAKRILADHLAGRAANRVVLFVLLTFGRWHKQHGRH